MTATITGTTHSATSSHPIGYWFSIVAVNLCLLYRLTLTLSNSGAMKVFLAIGKAKTNRANMTGKTDFAPARQFFSRKFALALRTSKNVHHKLLFVP
jgi:hypothetical protein